MSDLASCISRLVQGPWSYCNVLRDDGLSYQDCSEQLTSNRRSARSSRGTTGTAGSPETCGARPRFFLEVRGAWRSWLDRRSQRANTNEQLEDVMDGLALKVMRPLLFLPDEAVSYSIRR